MKPNIPLLQHSTTPFLHSSQLIILFFILHFAFFNLQCKKPTPPDVDDTPKPGKRDYTWTIDTLAYPGSFQTLMRDIWASSPTNVYVVGHNDQGGQGTMFRFDGNKWRAVDLGSIIIGGISLSAIYGFGPNNIYAVGRRIYDNPTPPPNFLDSSLIIHFDGVRWNDIQIPRKRSLSSISGFKKESLWATGHLGVAYSFNGQSWKLEKVPMDFNSEEYNWGVRATSDSKNDYMIISAYLNSTGQSKHYFLIRRDKTWVLKDTFYIGYGNFAPRFGGKFFYLPSGELYSVGYALFKYEGESWKNLYQSNTSLSSIWGTRKDHLFICGSHATLLHFNGIDWYEYPIIGDPYWGYYGVWCDETEVFVVANDGLKTYIIHGK